MKVNEAKTKVCPFMLSEKFGNEYFYTNCICGDCMAWVYTKVKSCGNMRGYYATQNDYKELPENEKEGYCKRIGDV